MAFLVSTESQINRKNVWNIYYAIYLNDYTQGKNGSSCYFNNS